MFQLITDSCCDLPAERLAELDVAYIPMVVALEGKEYTDDMGQSFDTDWFLAKLKEHAQPTTSQINVGRYMEHFRPYVDAGTPILYLGFSSGMSGSFQSAVQAVALLKEEYETVNISLIDTKSASLGEGLLVAEAAKRKAAGASLLEVSQWVEEHKMQVDSWVTVDDLKQLERGGRISKTAAAIGGLLNVKPIITVDMDGKLRNVDKVRGRNKSIQNIVDHTIANLQATQTRTVYIANAGDDEAADKVIASLREKILDVDIYHYPLGPTISSHTGYGCLAVFSFGTSRVASA
ncbi:DegV family protein [Enterococcus sp.]|uniref:DegV family protein n=1 Tax=Enterococcus sp. TaxID=35783 RepID=UPI0028971B05|nr:DegV family protein [Enterococcus sp.]